ncbi:uracil-DNA glycosylase family protein [Gluconacetobacter entanii]|uniref:Uracil-DNA glycosylase n=1 Tax=Gluconacetobacter entanii TaxID=108528 RepID=A0A318PTY7_9PROT|nr:uracil-DNA glycosylase family protein [Gluconacetobacter entanii]MCE2579944.1 uracil-DNA glycosylase family protein [Komagataeibacter sp. FNDCR1]MBY4639371.1 uracil-DNA glycosylase family protein [Gluconacetobacter entanii]MCW4582145.1 uracil-DNA glycosylase family protein [Gluconacetobacter entanii]MCW4585496.1 uracil-DNA glycosylase family protein [Gluconacetobacter entanii]MCW4588543.1 uracil-DNA glycosylase family protein [Gluconacetobacter entanii]
MKPPPTPPASADAGAQALEQLVRDIRACTACAAVLPLGPRPVLHVSPTARILIASQAPGTRVHETGQSFNDASGDRLRGWLGIDRATFYDSTRIAIMPMGMCYPGRMPKGGDRPPRRECAPLWRDRVLALMPDIRLTLLVGSYAQNYVLGPGKVEDRVRHYRDFLPQYFPLPHPSWRTGAWERRSPWFGEEVLPALRRAVHALL